MLTAHILSSVGWLGSVAAFLALAITGLVGADAQAVRASYGSMAVVTWCVIIPASGASLVTGVASSLGTSWGLLRHYWVLIKLVITVAATVVLLLHTRPIDYMAHAAAQDALSRGALRPVRLQLVVDAGAALGALLITTALGVYKPRGTTSFRRTTS